MNTHWNPPMHDMLFLHTEIKVKMILSTEKAGSVTCWSYPSLPSRVIKHGWKIPHEIFDDFPIYIYIQMENLHLSLISLAVSKTKQQRAQELACLLRHRRWPGRPRDSLPNWSAWWFGIPTPLKNMSSSVWVIIPNIWKVIKILLIIFSDCWTTWFIWLVVGFYPSEKSWSSSVGMILPNSMKNKIHVPNHQAVIYYPPK